MVIFYSAMRGKTKRLLLKTVETVVPEKDITICRNVAALSDMLRRPWSCEKIAILLTSGINEILSLLTLRELLWDMKIILVLPHSDPDSLAKGHLLRPRFVSDCDSNFREIAVVLKRLSENRLSTASY